nr:MAG TPA: hypothetical protein [Caudoviricetes sp.]
MYKQKIKAPLSNSTSMPQSRDSSNQLNHFALSRV